VICIRTRIFVVSEIERRNLLKAGIAEDKIVVNQNGVDQASSNRVLAPPRPAWNR
jgi:hypothetical protein